MSRCAVPLFQIGIDRRLCKHAAVFRAYESGRCIRQTRVCLQAGARLCCRHLLTGLLDPEGLSALKVAGSRLKAKQLVDGLTWSRLPYSICKAGAGHLHWPAAGCTAKRSLKFASLYRYALYNPLSSFACLPTFAQPCWYQFLYDASSLANTIWAVEHSQFLLNFFGMPHAGIHRWS